MTTTLLFCTSAKVTPELVRELQSTGKELDILNPFTPARHDSSVEQRPSKTEVEDFVEPFEGATDEDLRRLLAERERPVGGDRRNWLDGIIVVLDERSVADKTAVVHSYCYKVPEIDEDDPIDHGDEEPLIDLGWVTWRVFIRHCHQMVVLLVHVVETEQLLLLKEKERFTNILGVFELERALSWYEAPDRGRDGGAKLV